MDWQARPINIQSVKAHREYHNIITITDDNNQDWHYLQREDGQLILGYPVMLYEPEKSPIHMVHVFHPLMPGAIPILLRVVHVNDETHVAP